MHFTKLCNTKPTKANCLKGQGVNSDEDNQVDDERVTENDNEIVTVSDHEE